MNKTEAIKDPRLTDAERILINKMKGSGNHFIRGHRSMTGAAVFRLLDGKFNPMDTLPARIVNNLIEKGYLERYGNTIRLKNKKAGTAGR